MCNDFFIIQLYQFFTILSMNAVISLKKITKVIGEYSILDGISFDVPEGKIVGIIGKSGAGKTTLLRCINGLETPSSGDISLFGKNVVGLDEDNRRFFQRRIGTIFQSFNLISRSTIFDNVALPLVCRGFPKKVIEEKVRDVLELVGLASKEASYPSELSGGQCQRVAIARALVADVSLLLCDEFTSALDPETTLDILSLLAKLNQSLKLTILLITHDMNVVREICDHVIVLDQGRIAEEGEISEILLKPKHIVTKSLVGSLFKRDLPEHMLEELRNTPSQKSHVILRMMFADKVASVPVIASLVEQFHLPVNIIAGHLDHIRTTAFGQLIVSFPFVQNVYDEVVKYLDHRQVATELLGYRDV